MKPVHTIKKYRQAFETLCNKGLVQSMYNECKELMDRVLLALHGEEHTRRRGIELKLFRRDFIRYYEKEVYPKALAATLAPYLERGGMDLVEFGYRVNMNLSADISGVDRPLKTVEETEQLLAFVKKFSEGATLFHSTRDKNEVRQEVADALETFDKLFFQPSKQRREALLAQLEAGEISEEALPRDILTILLQSRDKSGMSEAMIRREIGFFLQAAAHSTGNSTVHAFHEIITWCKAHPEDWARVQNDPIFLQRCVHESLRLHPASPVAWRTAACPMSLADGQQAEESDSVMVDLEMANRDPEIFGADAESYNPHRTIEGRSPPYALTFGVGVHTCFGRDLAGGVVPKEDADPDQHYYGIVTSLIRSLLAHGARPDPNNPRVLDATTERDNWGKYPVVFDGREL